MEPLAWVTGHVSVKTRLLVSALLLASVGSCTGSPEVVSPPAKSTGPASDRHVAFQVRGSPPPSGARCPTPPRPDPYGIRVHPTAGSAGSNVKVSGKTPLFNKAGRYLGPSGKIGFWFNLPPDGWESVYFGGPAPSTNEGSPVIHLGEANVQGKCSYRVTFHVPNVTPGTYALLLIEHGGGGAAALSKPIDFRVTS